MNLDIRSVDYLIQQGQLKDALAALHNIKQGSLGNSVDVVHREFFLYTRLKKYEQVIDCFKKLPGNLQQQENYLLVIIDCCQKATQFDTVFPVVSGVIKRSGNHNLINKLGYSLIKRGKYQSATEYFSSVINSGYSRLANYIGLAETYAKRGLYQQAIETLSNLDKVSALDYVSLYNLGLYTKEIGQYSDALQYFERAKEKDRKRHHAYIQLTGTHLLIGNVKGAIACLEEGIMYCGALPVLTNELARVKLEYRYDAPYAKYYEIGLDKLSKEHFIGFLNLLVHTKDWNTTEQVLDIAKSKFKHSGPWHLIECQLCYERGEYENGILALENTNEGFSATERMWRARCNIAVGNYSEALNDTVELTKEHALDQGYWCLHASALELAGATDYVGLNDFDGLIDSSALQGFDANDKLADTLMGIHEIGAPPIGQSVVGGTQTLGNILNLDNAVIQDFKSSLIAHIQTYIANLPESKEHPTRKFAGSEFKFSGAWSVCLKDNGFHTSHYHSRGWISGVYYVEVPELTGNEGALHLGKMDLQGVKSEAKVEITPKQGHVVLFPSYMWHGTNVLKNDKRRLTIAFDLLPIFEN
ncbi:2OG-Fe(II) oxygenase family protein [Pseudoalteromonas sp. SSDWG2]|uniref:2OG-Fe(II) oxygenase family protein n=1 Tax=Pseudoalteromonas sp. SSDWG2 TaxID=3139391 RepID=UPI003BA98335